MAIARTRAYTGPAILSYGFRPFFLAGSLFAGLAVLIWLPMMAGLVELPTAFGARDWHVHEMLYGFLPAVITGFLLTAIPNWTGRLPLQGRPLLVLVLVWLAGRAAVSFSAWLGWSVAAAVDASFLALVAAAAGREILAGRNWRNLKVLFILVLLLAGNVAFHVEARIEGHAELGTRLGMAAIVMLVMLIGGRIVPSFTRNWLARENPGRLPAPFGRFDVATMALAGTALASWVVAPASPSVGALLILAGIFQAVRLSRWCGYRTAGDGLVLILHVAYAFVPLGFVLLGASELWPRLPASAGLHAWSGGAFGAMTLAVMSRATLGHTGRALVASPALRLVYLLIVAAALARVAASTLDPQWSLALLTTAAFLWSAAFLGFSAVYWTALTGPKLS